MSASTYSTELMSIMGKKSLYSVLLGTMIGTTFFNSFITGPVAYSHLPRQQFGNLQSQLFPHYFRLQTAGTAALLAILYSGKLGIKAGRDSIGGKLNLALIGTMLTTAVLNLTLAGPMTTEIMRRRHRLERLEGTTYDAKDTPRSPKMAELNKSFMIGHSISALLNLGFLGAAALHAGWLAENIGVAFF